MRVISISKLLIRLSCFNSQSNPGNLPNVSLDQVSTDVTTLQTQLQSLQSTGTQKDSQLGDLVSSVSIVQGQTLKELQSIQAQLAASKEPTISNVAKK